MQQRRTDYGAPMSRTLVASYRSYAEAQRAVDHLSDNGFPVDKVSIVAEDLRFVERVTGRVGYGRAALNGLSSAGQMQAGRYDVVADADVADAR